MIMNDYPSTVATTYVHTRADTRTHGYIES